MNTELKERLLEDPASFISYYFRHRIIKLEPFHLRLIEKATTHPRSLILFPAAHGKTTLISTLLPIWGLCKDPNIRITVIARNDQDAKSIMRAIHAELQGNEELLRDFGPFKPEDDDSKPWALERLSVAKRTIRNPRATIEVVGSGGNILGHRSDWVICDDVVTEKNTATPEQREKMKQWFNLGVETMPEYQDSRLTVVGTVFDPEDLYHDLMLLVYPDTGEPIYEVQHEDAIVDEENHITLWPDRWPWKRLMMEKAKNGTIAFNKRYRNIAVDASRMVFKEEFVKGGYIGKIKYPGCLDREHVVGDYGDNWPRFCGFDPARGATRHAKFCAHITIAMGSCDLPGHDRCMWIVDLQRDQMTFPQMADLVLAKHEEYDAFSSRVEANSLQEGLIDIVRERMNERGVQWRIEPHLTTRINKVDPEVGVARMSPWFENGLVHIPQGNPESLGKMQQLIDELVQYPGRTTDTVMALWFAWMAAQEAGPKFRTTNRLHKPETFWGKHAVGRRMVKNPYYA